MKTLALLLLFASTMLAADVTVDVHSITAGAVANRTCTITLTKPSGPVVVGPWLIAGDSVSQQTGTNGKTTFTNMQTLGQYRLDVAGNPSRSFPFSISGTSGVYNVSQLIGTNVFPEMFYDTAQIDALLSGLGGTVSNIQGQVYWQTNPATGQLTNNGSDVRLVKSLLVSNTLSVSGDKFRVETNGSIKADNGSIVSDGSGQLTSSSLVVTSLTSNGRGFVNTDSNGKLGVSFDGSGLTNIAGVAGNTLSNLSVYNLNIPNGLTATGTPFIVTVISGSKTQTLSLSASNFVWSTNAVFQGNVNASNFVGAFVGNGASLSNVIAAADSLWVTNAAGGVSNKVGPVKIGGGTIVFNNDGSASFASGDLNIGADGRFNGGIDIASGGVNVESGFLQANNLGTGQLTFVGADALGNLVPLQTNGALNGLVLRGNVVWTNGLLSGTNQWESHLVGSSLDFFGNKHFYIQFDTNGTIYAQGGFVGDGSQLTNLVLVLPNPITNTFYGNGGGLTNLTIGNAQLANPITNTYYGNGAGLTNLPGAAFVQGTSGHTITTNGNVYSVGTNYIFDNNGLGTNTTIDNKLTIKGHSFGVDDGPFVIGTEANGQAGIYNQDNRVHFMIGANGFGFFSTNQYPLLSVGDLYNGDMFTRGAWTTTSGNRVPFGKRPGMGFAGTYRNSNAGIDAYFQSVGGSGAALADLPVDGPAIWANQRKPYIILDTRSGNGSDVDNIVSCSLSSVTNGLLAFKTNGYLAYFTNLNVGVAMCMENGWLTNHRDLDSGLLRWNTNRFPWLTGNDTMATNVTKYLRTNNVEAWLMMYGDSWVPAYNNWPGSTTSELDVDPRANNGRWDYPYGVNGTGVSDANVQPVMSSDSFHKDISTMYMWGISGIIFQDVNPGATAGVFDQVMRTTMGAILNPYYRPGQLTEEVDVDQQFNAYYKQWPFHGMISGYLMGGAGVAWSTKYLSTANQLWTETSDATVEPAGSGALGWLMGQVRYESSYLTNMNTMLYPTFAGDGLNESTMTYQGWHDYLAGNAMFGGNIWLFKDYAYCTSNSFGLLITNGNFVRVWQDATRPIFCERLDSTNAIFSRTESSGQKLVWFCNEGNVATNLTVNWGQLGIVSNQIAWANDLFTNASLGKFTNAMTVTVGPASSYIVELFPGIVGDGSSLTNISYANINGALWETNNGSVQPVNNNAVDVHSRFWVESPLKIDQLGDLYNAGNNTILKVDDSNKQITLTASNGVLVTNYSTSSSTWVKSGELAITNPPTGNWLYASNGTLQLGQTNSGSTTANITLYGQTGKASVAGLTNTSLTASTLAGVDANKALSSITVGTDLLLSGSTLSLGTAGANVTNGETLSITVSNDWAVDASHTLKANGQMTAVGMTNQSAVGNALSCYDANGKFISLNNGGTHTLVHGSTPPTYSALDLASDVTGLLPVASLTTPANASQVLVGSSPPTWAVLPSGPFIQASSGYGTNTTHKGMSETNDATGNYETFTNGTILVVQSNNIAANIVYGLDLTNNQGAASSSQKYSPAIHFGANGYRSSSVAGSKAVQWREYVVPVQDSASPYGYLRFDSATNDSTTFAKPIDFGYGGDITNFGVVASGSSGKLVMIGANGTSSAFLKVDAGGGAGLTIDTVDSSGPGIQLSQGGTTELQITTSIIKPKSGQTTVLATSSQPFLNFWTRDIFATNRIAASRGFFAISNGGWGPLFYMGTNTAQLGGGVDAVNNTNQFEVDVRGVTPAFNIHTNGIVYAASLDNSTHYLETNALSAWPTVALTPGGAAFVNSNATVYILTSTPASTAWAATNKIAGP